MVLQTLWVSGIYKSFLAARWLSQKAERLFVIFQVILNLLSDLLLLSFFSHIIPSTRQFSVPKFSGAALPIKQHLLCVITISALLLRHAVGFLCTRTANLRRWQDGWNDFGVLCQMGVRSALTQRCQDWSLLFQLPIQIGFWWLTPFMESWRWR